MFTLTVLFWAFVVLGLSIAGEILVELFYRWKDRGIKTITYEGADYPWHGEWNECKDYKSSWREEQESEFFNIRNHDMNEYMDMVRSEFKCPMCERFNGQNEHDGAYWHDECLVEQKAWEEEMADREGCYGCDPESGYEPIAIDDYEDPLKLEGGQDWDDVNIPF